MRHIIAEKLTARKHNDIALRAIKLWHRGFEPKDDITAAELDELAREIAPFGERHWFKDDDTRRILGYLNEAACFQVYTKLGDDSYVIEPYRFAAFDPHKAKELTELGTRIARLSETNDNIADFTDKWGMPDYVKNPLMLQQRATMSGRLCHEIFPLLAAEFKQTPNIKKSLFTIDCNLPLSNEGIMFCNRRTPRKVTGNPLCVTLGAPKLYSSLAHEIYHLYQYNASETDKLYQLSLFFSARRGANYYGSKIEREAYFLAQTVKEKIEQNRTKNLYNLLAAENVYGKSR